MILTGYRLADLLTRVATPLIQGEFSSILAAQLGFLPSLDHLIRPREHFRRNSQADLLSRLKVNDEFKLRCLLHRQISRFGTFQYLVEVNRRAPIEVNVIRPVGHKAALIDKLLLEVNSRQPVFT